MGVGLDFGAVSSLIGTVFVFFSLGLGATGGGDGLDCVGERCCLTGGEAEEEGREGGGGFTGRSSPIFSKKLVFSLTDTRSSGSSKSSSLSGSGSGLLKLVLCLMGFVLFLMGGDGGEGGGEGVLDRSLSLR